MKLRIGVELRRRIAEYRQAMNEGPEVIVRKAMRKHLRIGSPALPEYRESTYRGTVLTVAGTGELTADDVRRLLWWWVPEQMERRSARAVPRGIEGKDYTVEEWGLGEK